MGVRIKLLWQLNPFKFEKYLEKMQAKGKQVEYVGDWYLTFKKVPVEKDISYVYCVDYRPIAENYGLNTEYYTMLKDDKWELLTNKKYIYENNARYEADVIEDYNYRGINHLCHYIWRKKYHKGEARPELFNDIETRVEKNKRFMIYYLLLGLVIPIFLIIMRLPDLLIYFSPHAGEALALESRPIAVVVSLLIIACMGIGFKGYMDLRKVNRDLKSRVKK